MRNYYNSYYNNNRDFQQPQGTQDYYQQGSYNNVAPSSYGQVGYNSNYNYYGNGGGHYRPYNYGYNYSQPQGTQDYYQQGSYNNVAPSSYGQVGYNSNYNYYGNGGGHYRPYNYGYNYSQPQGTQGYYQQGSYNNVAPSSYNHGTSSLGRYSSLFCNNGGNIGTGYPQNQSGKGLYEPFQQGNKFGGYNRC